MATVEEIARRSLAAVGSLAPILLAGQWVSQRYSEAVGRVRFRHLRRLGYLTIPASYDTGTITAVVGSLFVTGSGTAWTGDMEGRFFRARVVWYRIERVLSPTSLQLSHPYSEDAITAVAYRVVQRYASLDDQARWIGKMVHPRRRREIIIEPLDVLDVREPSRQWVSGGPDVAAEFSLEVSPTGGYARTYEFFPYSTTDETVSYVYWIDPRELELIDPLPVIVDEENLIAGVLVDVMRWHMGQALHLGKIDEAATWRNEYRAQETKWAQAIRDMIYADKGTDDTTFLFSTIAGLQGYTGYDIRTARDHVLDRWSR